MEYKHSKEAIKELMGENKRMLERSIIMERFMQRKNLLKNEYAGALGAEQKKISMYKEMLAFLQELDAE